ncbi:site-specific integrase [Clostridium tagluense]|uniref:site-specific integrase n=1 Tax=Clostridium tagluense TaxID=360422 RepID=UPI001CF205AD|nr:site-specific integrase [Clostridium tagluense]MCB2314176.1 site-specific integrase [Clostridium tagluense]MCB2319026.1 site-specific integrase [Clostridium tagluense]MCB2323917.1 site-specific integrase [Clostridium tagluense]MCB2328765.1 site-specific integrase [Clostridium tagluense]MCB2333618.1 site-specific integrase [Clostridium tagluense]
MSNGNIVVKQALVRVKIFDENKNYESKLIFQEPKTKAGIRNIPLPPNVLVLLNTHRLNQSKENLLVGYKYEDQDLVFCTELGHPIEPRNFIRKFQQLLKISGLEKTNIHSLRHTYATRLLELNEHPKVVQELLGHSTIAITLDIYSHVFPEIKKATADKINDLFKIKNNFVKEEPSSYAV